MQQEYARPRRVVTAEERFWAKVQKSAACWLWAGGHSPEGYGRFWFQGRLEGAHRVAHLLLVGPIPDSLDVLHRCDNPPCVRPDHLFLGDALANSADMVAKGRAPKGEGWRSCPERMKLPVADPTWMERHPERIARGERARKSSLTASQVADMRAKHGNGATISTLSREYGVSRTAIRYIVRREHWTHVA